MTDDKIYRGRSLEEILPRIKAELGPDAVITRQRDGLTGGVGGFFQRPCIEVEARPAPSAPAGSFDAFDEPESVLPDNDFVADDFVSGGEPAAGDAATREGLGAPAIQEVFEQAAPFADQLSAAEARGFAHERDELEASPRARYDRGADEPGAGRIEGRPPAPGTQPRWSSVAEGLWRDLTVAGIEPGLATDVVQETVSHRLPFGSPRALKRLVREALAARIPVAARRGVGGRALAFVGPGGSGKTMCTARLAAAYADGSDLPLVCLSLHPSDDGAELYELLEPAGVQAQVAVDAEQAGGHVAAARGGALVVVDTPAVTPASPQDVATLAAELRTIGLDEVHLAVPSTFSGAAARELQRTLEPLAITHFAVTHTDASPQIGALVDLVIESGVPVSYVSGGTDLVGGLEPADPVRLAAMVLP